MNNKSNALAVFDSGVGGLTVLDSLTSLMPNETIYYLADTLNLPYGNKSKEKIQDYCLGNVSFLTKYPIKALIIACHTASALAYDSLRARFNIPLFDVITPAVEEATKKTKNGKIAVLATESTIHSNVYEKLLKQRMNNSTVISIACPLLVPLVEENLLSKKIADKLVQQYLTPIKDSDIDTVILGCTHYPLLKNLIQSELSSSVQIINSAQSCAKNVQQFLEKNKLNETKKEKGKYHFLVSGQPDSFQIKGSIFLKKTIETVKKIES
ncbi:MAG: Glutamate racemase [Chlamydiae bacterium]|nr:Glutamate racemase [Chlamydiota bacterium]